MASGIIEYLAEGAWTKRLHPGWAAQAGIRAVDLARHGFVGPRTVLEGTHGFFHAFAHKTDGDWSKLTDGFGEEWVANGIAFKPYACGTMTQPYVDCALRDRSQESVSRQIHRARAREVARWENRRGTAGPHAWRRRGAALARRHRGEVQAELRVRRMGESEGGEVPGVGEGGVRRAHRP